MRSILGAISLLLILGGCSGEPETGPGAVRWDREICPRCAMVVSDHNYAAQVRGGPPGQKSKLYKFDDIGCAVIWLDERPSWRDDPATEIWVTDYRNGEWIDARKAWYVPGKITPMAYGLGATSEKEPNALDYEAAKKHIYAVEEKINIHGGGILDHPEPGE